MKSLIIKFGLLLILNGAIINIAIAQSNNSPSPVPGQEGNGGEICEKNFKIVRDDIQSWINEDGSKDLVLHDGITYAKYKTEMLNEISRAKLNCVKEGDDDYPVKVFGASKTCRNFKDRNGVSRIICDAKSFNSLPEEEQYILVHHEYAGLAGFEINNREDSDYRISNQISDYLESKVVMRLAVKKVNSHHAKIFQYRGGMCIYKPQQRLFCWGQGTGNLNNVWVNSLDDLSIGPNTDCRVLRDRKTVDCKGRFPVSKKFENPKKLAMGISHACVLDGSDVKCWVLISSPEYDQKYVDVVKTKMVEPAKNIKNVKDIASNWDYTCALLFNNTIKCWGDVPHNVPQGELVRPRNLQSNLSYSMCIESNGVPLCWGSNDTYGPLDRLVNDENPDTYRSLRDLSIGSRHTCVVTRKGSAACFGQGTSKGDKAIPKWEVRAPSVLEMPWGLSQMQVTSIAAGDSGMTCAILNKGPAPVVCWSYYWVHSYFYNNPVQYKGLTMLAKPQVDEYYYVHEGNYMEELLNPQNIESANEFLTTGP